MLVPEPRRKRSCGQPEKYQSRRYDRRRRYFRRQRCVEALADRESPGGLKRSGAARDRLVRVQSCGAFHDDVRRHFERARHENKATIIVVWGELCNTVRKSMALPYDEQTGAAHYRFIKE